MNISGFPTYWVYIAIIVIVVYFVIQGMRHGFWVVLADFFAFLGALLIALFGYQYVSGILREYFSLSRSIANALGFVITAILSEAILGYIFGHIVNKIPTKFRDKTTERFASIVPSVGEALVLISFILILAASLPIPPKYKLAINDSVIASNILERTSVVENIFGQVFNDAIEDSLTHLTINPGSTEVISLDVERYEINIDEASQREMFDLVNKERAKKGIPTLRWDEELLPAAHDHANDMWKRKYFGHVSPEGNSVGDRLDGYKVDYMLAGENLALAPTVSLAHTGLMNSEGHRENILETEFGRVAIGVIDNDVYGKLFVQVFAD